MKQEKLTLLERSRRNKPQIAAHFKRLYKELGIDVNLPARPVRELQALIAAEGILEENELSQDIIEMREE